MKGDLDWGSALKEIVDIRRNWLNGVIGSGDVNDHYDRTAGGALPWSVHGLSA